ncbi:MAG TPA: hypothetical protein VEK55_18860 [Xanthobacteraceae bacterium]|nr:hypothetical protein [Xanthobacteraceae bacterium]
MTKNTVTFGSVALVLSLAFAQASFGRDDYVTPWSGPYVIEKAHGDTDFVVEGRWVRALSGCPGWVAGDGVNFRKEPRGSCELINRSRHHQACAVSCSTYPAWKPFFGWF